MNEDTPTATIEPAKPKLDIKLSSGFQKWMAQEQLSLALTTYRTGKLLLLGLDEAGQLAVGERTFPSAMGLFCDGQSLWLATLFQLWNLQNCTPSGGPGESDGEDEANARIYDRIFVPRVSYVTGAVATHDVVVDATGQVVFANTAFSCLATVSTTHSFTPIWKPPFITEIAGGDRCHLNGVALRDGKVRYVTACGATDSPDGWRQHRDGGGCVVDVEASEIIASGFCMPHSPRWHCDRLWLCDSGTGNFGYVETDSGRFNPIVFCPGYARGLAFHGKYALIGLSLSLGRPRASEDLPLMGHLRARSATPRCGLMVLNLETGNVEHSLWLDGPVTELYDVVTLPGVRRPFALGLQRDDIHHAVSIGPPDPSLLEGKGASTGSHPG